MKSLGEDKMKENDEKEKSESHKERTRKLAQVFEGEFYLRQSDYQKALELYKKAQEKEKLKELAEMCGGRGEARIACEAMRAAEEFAPKELLKHWGNKALECGMLHDAIFAYKEAKCLNELPDSYPILYGIDRELFQKCGNIIFYRAERCYSEEKKEEAAKFMEDAARAYEIARRAKELVKIADWFMEKTPLRGDPNLRKAQEFYLRAAKLEIDNAEKKLLFSPDEFTKAAERAAELEEEYFRENPGAPDPFIIGRPKKRKDEDTPKED